MQCKDRHSIYVVDKKAIYNDIVKLTSGKHPVLNRKVLESHGNGNLLHGINEFFKGKWWVYYDRSPRHSKYILHKKLYEMGYFQFFETGCGKCEICRTEHSKEWATKAYCENQMWENATFLTLTYNNENLPKDRKLVRSHMQKFWKDLRYHLYKNTKKAQKIDLSMEHIHQEEIYSNELEDMFGNNSRRKNRTPIRYINCGEYGPKTKRPHYHAVVWNFKPLDLRRYSKDRRGYWLYTSEKINKIWKKGFVIIGNATTETAAYVARYCTKKYSKTEEEIKKMKEKKQLEFIGASSLGFIGYYYWLKFKDMIKQNKGILMKSKDHTFLAKLPKAMKKVWKEENEIEYEEYDLEKNLIGQENWNKILENTDLTESEFIENTWNAKMQKLRLLRRTAGDILNA